MNTSKAINEAKAVLGIDTLKAEQVEPINSILSGNDTFVIAPTSSGKSLDYLIPGLVYSPALTLVIEPTISLMIDQVEKLKSLGIGAEMISAKGFNRLKKILAKIKNKEITFLYVTPERLEKKEFKKVMRKNPPALIAVDEAHCITEWGNSYFREAYLQIGKFIDNLPTRPAIIALTATAPLEYRSQIIESLCMNDPQIFTSSLARSNIKVIIKETAYKNKKSNYRAIPKIIEKYSADGGVVIYCSNKNNVDIIYNYMKSKEEYENNIVKYYSDMPDLKLKSNALNFINGKNRIMIATSCFGMGVDKGDIDLIIHYNLPFSIVDWYQQIGRAGRDGRNAYAVLMYQEADIKVNRKILQGKNFQKQMLIQNENNSSSEIESAIETSLARFDDLIDLFNSKECYMKSALKYLGDDSAKNCNHCSNCQRRKKKK